ncbi:MAG TPA: PKD domain-containing protein, partial [Cytophagaceae bacterium]
MDRNWRILFWCKQYTIKDIVLHPTNPSIVFVASKSGFYRSTNGGSSFTQIGTGDYQEIEFHPTNPDIVYTVKLNTTTNRTEFYKSTNNGVTFTKKSTGWPSTGEQKRTEISVTPASPNRVYAYCTGSVNGGSGTYGTYLSTDQGETWTFQCCGSGPGGPPSASNKNLMGWDDKGLDDGGQYYYDMAYCVLPNDMNKVLLGGVNLWHSNDGGYDFTCPSKWSHSEKPQYVHADIHDIKAYGDDIWIACDGGIWYSNNAGATFEKRFKGIAGTDFWGFGIGYGANGHRVMTGGAYHNGTQVMDNDVYRGGWMVCNGGDGTGGEVNPVNDRMIFTDRGAQKLPGNRTAAITNLTFAKKPNNDYITGKASTIRYSPVNYNTVLLGEGTSLWKSTNGGVSFTQLYNFNEHVADFEISPLDEKTMYVATFGSVKKLYRTTNGGTSWTAITLPSTLDKSTGAPYDLVPSATNPNEIWIVKIGSTSALNGYKVFKSTDKGTTWQNLTTPTLNGENVVSITHHAGTNGGVYISTARTVYYRNASMSDWILFNNGLPAQTPSQKVLPDYWSGKLINATSRSVYESEFYEKAPPVAFFKADKVTTTCNGAAITFVDQSAVQGATGITRNWVFEGGIANSTTNGTVTVTYPLPGTYDVTLTVTDANGTHTRTIPDFITVTGSCTATTDIALNSITGITSGNKCSQQFTPSIEVLNSGVITITSYTVKVYLDGVLNKTLTQTTNLTSGQKATVNLGSFDLSNVAAFQVVLE